MKVRTDFVTNSSSSSYCMIVIDREGGYSKRLSFNLTYEGFYTFWFHDPSKLLAECKSMDDLKGAISYSLGGQGVGGVLDRYLANVLDFAEIESIELHCHEEIDDRDWDDPWPRNVTYTYDFKTGKKTTTSDCHWQKYRGYGDSLAPDVHGMDGSTLPFYVEETKGMQCVMGYTPERSEDGFVLEPSIAIPGEVLLDGERVTVQGLGRGCFDDGSGIEVIELPSTIEYIAPDAFEFCMDTLREVRVEGHEAEGPYLRMEGGKLVLAVFGGTELTIPDDVAELGASAFGGCWNLESIALHDGMKKPTKAALCSTPTLRTVKLSSGSEVSVAEDDAKKCFTVSKGIIGFNYAKCAELMLDAGNASEFKIAVECGDLSNDVLEEFYAKIKLKRKPEFKEMKEFLREKIDGRQS